MTGYYLVRFKQLEPFRDLSRGHYLTLTLADRTGQVLARIWEGALELAEQFDAGEVVKVAGEVENYRDRTQIIVVKLRRAEVDEFDLRDMQRTTLQEIEALHSQLQAFIGAVDNPHLNALLRHFFDDKEFLSAFSAAPAARRVHHAYVGGFWSTRSRWLPSPSV